MPLNNASVLEDTLDSPRNAKASVSASGFKVTQFGNPNVDTFTVDASGNATVAGTLTATGGVTAATLTNPTISGNLRRSASGAVTAGTTQTQVGATALTSDINNVSVCANDNDGVKLPAAVVGMAIDVFNPTAHTLKVWPATGDDLGAGANTATTQATTVNNRYVCYATAKWQKL